MPIPLPKNKKRRSLYQEKSIAKELGGFNVKGSGSGKTKSDVVIKGIIRIEAKITKKSKYTIKLSDLYKIKREAYTNGELPLFCFYTENGNYRYMVINKGAYDDLGLDYRIVATFDARGKKSIEYGLRFDNKKYAAIITFDDDEFVVLNYSEIFEVKRCLDFR